MVKFDKAPTNLSGDLNEIIYQVNQEPNFGDQQGDQEIRLEEEDEVTEFWEDEDQEECGEICALTGERKGGGCWICGKFGHLKVSCPLRRWSRVGRAAGISYRKEQGGRSARPAGGGNGDRDRSGAKPAYGRSQSGGYQGSSQPRKDF